MDQLRGFFRSSAKYHELLKRKHSIREWFADVLLDNQEDYNLLEALIKKVERIWDLKPEHETKLQVKFEVNIFLFTKKGT